MSEAIDTSALEASVADLPLDEIDVADPDLYEQDIWRP